MVKFSIKIIYHQNLLITIHNKTFQRENLREINSTQWTTPENQILKNQVIVLKKNKSFTEKT